MVLFGSGGRSHLSVVMGDVAIWPYVMCSTEYPCLFHVSAWLRLPLAPVKAYISSDVDLGRPYVVCFPAFLLLLGGWRV